MGCSGEGSRARSLECSRLQAPAGHASGLAMRTPLLTLPLRSFSDNLHAPTFVVSSALTAPLLASRLCFSTDSTVRGQMHACSFLPGMLPVAMLIPACTF
ncbi:hypothetical protein ABPG77_004587 [Micractinium sp. CCAP 211/92]